jgi:carboxyl-terminal processing protease
VRRPFRYSLYALPLGLVVYGSFAGGQMLRKASVGPIEVDMRVSSLPESNIGGSGSAKAAEQDETGNPAETFQEVLRYVKLKYVDRIDDDKKLGFGAVRTMLISLDDPKTRFLEPDQRKALLEQINGSYTGIGANLTVVKQKKGKIDQRRLAVVAPAPGGPADKAGLRPGDILTEIDGHWIIAYDPRADLADLHLKTPTDDKEYRKAYREAAKKLTDGVTLPKALERLTGKDGKELTLTVERTGAPQPLKVKVTTATTSVEPVEFKELNANTAYLRVTQFNDRATEAFSAALSNAKQKNLILDLRDNAGGPAQGRTAGALGSALSLVTQLTPGGQVATIERKGKVTEPLTVKGTGGKLKTVVLVNGGTANLAEMVASALKEKGRATLVGSKTFGDAAFQKLVDLQDGAAMTLTAGKFLSGAGADLSKGLLPDVQVVAGGPQSGDAVVNKALAALAGA